MSKGSKLLLSNDDVACLHGAHPKLRNYVNSYWVTLCGKVEAAVNVPLIDRDSLYYAHCSFIRGDILTFKSNIDFLYNCSIISFARCMEIRDKAEELLEHLERDGVYA